MRDRYRRQEIRQGGANVREARPGSTPRGNKSIRKLPRGARRGFLRQRDFSRGREYPSRIEIPAYGWAIPVQRPFLQEIKVSDEKNHDVEKHFYESEPMQLAEDIGPRIQENRFHIE